MVRFVDVGAGGNHDNSSFGAVAGESLSGFSRARRGRTCRAKENLEELRSTGPKTDARVLMASIWRGCRTEMGMDGIMSSSSQEQTGSSG